MQSVRWRLGLGGALLALAGCTSAACEPDRLPHRGVPKTSKELFELVQYAAHNECWSTLYDCMSKKTRDEHSYLKIWAFFRTVELPKPWKYNLVDVIEGGTFVAAAPLSPGRELVLVSYQEPGKPELLAQILVVQEAEDGQQVRRMALEEQRHHGPAFNQEPAPAEVAPGG